jgi:hypothetical protein
MLILSHGVKRESTAVTERAEPGYIIEPLFVGSAKVIDDGLSEVITIIYRRA